MKAFLISIVLIIIILTCIFINVFYIRYITDEILEIIKTLPAPDIIEAAADDSGGSRAIDKISQIWEKNKNFIAASISYEYIFSVDLSLKNLKAYYEAHDKAEYSASAKLLQSCVERIQEIENFALNNIL